MLAVCRRVRKGIMLVPEDWRVKLGAYAVDVSFSFV